MTTKTTYKKDEYGTMVETNASIIRRIANKFGFQQSRIVLCEASYVSFERHDGKRFSYCNHVDFRVNGYGYSTDLDMCLMMNEAYNA